MEEFAEERSQGFAEEKAQEFAEELMSLENDSRQEALEILLDNLDSETRGMISDFFEA